MTAIADPNVVRVLTGCADALREAGRSFAGHNPRAARPNLFELHEREARRTLERIAGPATGATPADDPLDLLCLALPYVEEAAETAGYKRASVKQLVERIFTVLGEPRSK